MLGQSRTIHCTLLGMLCALLLAPAGACHAITAEEIIKRAMDLNDAVHDYRAEVIITTIAESIDIPPRRVTIYYKRPDKMRVDSEQIAMVPKAAVNMHALGTMFAKNSRAVMGGQKSVDGRTLYNIKLLPKDDETQRGRVLVWVWGDTWTVQKLEAYEGLKKRFSARWTYQKVDARYWMPQWIIFTTEGMGGRAGPMAAGGEIRLYFSAVEVNVGLSDGEFERQ